MLTTTSKTKPAIVASGPFSVDPTSKTVRAGFAALIAARGRTPPRTNYLQLLVDTAGFKRTACALLIAARTSVVM